MHPDAKSNVPKPAPLLHASVLPLTPPRRRPGPSWSRCALVMHGVATLVGPKSRLAWLRPVCATIAHQVAVVSTYVMLGYYDVVRRAAFKRSITGWRILWVHAALHYGPVAWWDYVKTYGHIRGWHKGVALVLHALWFWFGVGGTRRGLESVYAEMPGSRCWGELGLVSLVGVLTAGNYPVTSRTPA